MSVETTAYQLLFGIKDRAAKLAEQGEAYFYQSTRTRGIGYIINGVRFFSDAEEIGEVGVCDQLIHVPQTKPWIRGLFNSKGRLYSVVDLAMLAGVDTPTTAKHGHLLILKNSALQVALLVNRVIGFRQFDVEALHEVTAQRSNDWWDGLSAFLVGGYEEAGVEWMNLDIKALLESELFREVQ